MTRIKKKGGGKEAGARHDMHLCVLYIMFYSVKYVSKSTCNVTCILFYIVNVGGVKQIQNKFWMIEENVLHKYLTKFSRIEEWDIMNEKKYCWSGSQTLDLYNFSQELVHFAVAIHAC